MIIYYHPLVDTPVHLIFSPPENIAHIYFRNSELSHTFAYSSQISFNFWTVLSIPFLILEPHI